MTATLPIKAIWYPESDGRPMGETDRHRSAMIRHIEILSRYYAGQQVYVTGDLLVYYEAGDPTKFIVPDAFVAKGLEPGERRTYKIWEEGKPPDVVIETTSRKTRKKDATIKPSLYAQLGVPEYFIFDPEGDYLAPRLQGFRLVGESYERIPSDANGRLESVELGLWLSFSTDDSDHDIEFHEVATGERLLTNGEALLYEREARLKEREARHEAEAEIARLRAELARQTSAS